MTPIVYLTVKKDDLKHIESHDVARGKLWIHTMCGDAFLVERVTISRANKPGAVICEDCNNG